MSCKITILIDNNGNPDNPALHSEHGLSIYFEIDSQKWLYDTGASDKFYENARLLGINLAEIDHLILSHGHNDHTGGLERFLSLNKHADIIVSENITKNKYYSARHGERKDISIDADLIDSNSSRTVFTDKSYRVSDNVDVVRNSVFVNPAPKANLSLEKSDTCRCGYLNDDFDHEISIAIKTEYGLLILSSCSHHGVMNIVESCRNFTGCDNIAAFIGGTHLVDGEYETPEELNMLTKKLTENKIVLYSGHCTGEQAAKSFSKNMNGSFHTFFSGATYVFRTKN